MDIVNTEQLYKFKHTWNLIFIDIHYIGFDKVIFVLIKYTDSNQVKCNLKNYFGNDSR